MLVLSEVQLGQRALASQVNPMQSSLSSLVVEFNKVVDRVKSHNHGKYMTVEAAAQMIRSEFERQGAVMRPSVVAPAAVEGRSRVHTQQFAMDQGDDDEIRIQEVHLAGSDRPAIFQFGRSTPFGGEMQAPSQGRTGSLFGANLSAPSSQLQAPLQPGIGGLFGINVQAPSPTIRSFRRNVADDSSNQLSARQSTWPGMD